jgi:ubiquinone/menaquinone biosynthesis C-methylase UbiE
MSKYGLVRRQRVCELVKHLVPRGHRILEVSCGRGEILKGLQDEGYAVQGTNCTRYPYCPDSIRADTGVDILRGLPYESGNYDCVILSEVIEHLSDHAAAVKEICRVAKNGGYVIVVTPNMMKINSRINFLLTGFFKVNKAFVGFDVPLDRSFGFHLYPSHLPTFLYQLHANNVDAVAIDAVGYKAKSYLFWLMLIPFILRRPTLRPICWKSISVAGHLPDYSSNPSCPSRLSAARAGSWWAGKGRPMPQNARWTLTCHRGLKSIES